MTITDTAPFSVPGTYPVPASRGRWRLTLHNRVYGASLATPAQTSIGELSDAYGRRLEQQWNQTANLTFSLDGHSPAAAEIMELEHDVMGWRWDDQQGTDVPLFRGPICQSEDQLTEQSHTVTFTCHDYLALLTRRSLTQPTPLVYTQQDQDNMVLNLLTIANRPRSSTNQDVFYPGSTLPLAIRRCNPDGSIRSVLSGQLRDRTYLGGQQIYTAIDDLARVINGFDYDVLPGLSGSDSLRIFYNPDPTGTDQGILRSTPGLQYGVTVSAVTRSVNSADYANYYRVLGNNGSSDPNAAQMYAETWNQDSNNVGQVPVGLWMGDEAAADVSVQATLNDKAAGDLALNGVLVPSYTLTMRPGAYSYGNPNMGDTVPLVIQSGRLNVNTVVRVLGIAYDIGEDGNETVSLTVGRAPLKLAHLINKNDRTVRALTRR